MADPSKLINSTSANFHNLPANSFMITRDNPMPNLLFNHLLAPIVELKALLFLFLIILTLSKSGEIMSTSDYGAEPASHIVELGAMNCPSGPFWVDFLIPTYLFFAVITASVVTWR